MPLLLAIFVGLSLLTSALLAQGADVFGSQFFRVTITANEKPLLAGAIFEDTAGKLIMKMRQPGYTSPPLRHRSRAAAGVARRVMARVLPEPEALATVAVRLVQSGLILERRAVPLDVLVVTAIERPVLDASDR